MIRKIIFLLILVLTDTLSVLFAGILSYYLRSALSWLHLIPAISQSSFFKVLWIVIVAILSFLYKGLYFKRLPFWLETKDIVVALLSCFIISLAIMTLGKIHDVSRLLVVFWMGISFILVPVARYFVKVFISKKGIYRDNLMIIGVNDFGIKAAEVVLKQPSMGFNLTGFLDDAHVGEEVEVLGRKFKVVSKVRRFPKIKRVYDVGVFMVALPDAAEDELMDLVNSIHRISSKVMMVPAIRGVAMFNAEIIPPFMDSLLIVNLRNNLMYRYNYFLKRFMDISVGLLALAIFSPVMIIISIAIKVTSPGPILFRQKRYGYNGKEFWVYKFRSMYEDAEDRLNCLMENDPLFKDEYEKKWKVANDPRITPVGRILRRFSLDELPQIFNVLKGDMSVVGPRPYLPSERYAFKDVEKILFMVRPGITGLWQVSGRSDTDYRFRVETDVWYVLNWTPWLDFMILAKTVWVVLRGKGAY